MKTSHLILLILAVCSGVPSIVHAADDISFDMSLRELQTIEISSPTRFDHTLATSPASVTVFRQKDIHAMGVKDVFELLNFVPGLQATREAADGDGPSLHLRGISKGSISNHCLMLIDGQRINEEHDGGATVVRRIIPITNIERVEVIRGPGSSAYGSNAFNAVVNIITRTTGNFVDAAVSTHGDIEGAFGARVASEDVNLYVSGNLLRRIGSKYDWFGDTITDPLTYQQLQVRADVHGVQVDGSVFFRSGQNFLQFSSPGEHQNWDKATEWFVRAKYGFGIAENIDLQTSIAYTRRDWDALARLVPAGATTHDGELEQDFLAGPIFEMSGVEFASELNWDLSDQHTVSAGISLMYGGNDSTAGFATHADFATGWGEFMPDNAYYQKGIVVVEPIGSKLVERKRTTVGAFVQYRGQLTEDITVYGGARFDSYSDGAPRKVEDIDATNSGQLISPRGALVYKTPFDSWVKVFVGQAFRAPALFELYQTSPVTIANPEIEPEVNTTVEIQYLQHTEYLSATVSLFQHTVSNRIEQRVAENNLLRYTNTASASVTGLEIEVLAVPFSAVSLRGTYTHFLDGDTERTYDHFGSFVLLTHPLEHTSFSLRGIYRPKLEELPNQEAYTVLSARLGQHVGKDLFVYVDALNLLNTSFDTYGIQTRENRVPNRPQEILLGLELLL